MAIYYTPGQYCGYPKDLHRQEAQGSQRDHTVLLVIEYLAKSLEVIGNSTFQKFWYGSYSHSTATIAVSLAVSETFNVK